MPAFNLSTLKVINNPTLYQVPLTSILSPEGRGLVLDYFFLFIQHSMLDVGCSTLDVRRSFFLPCFHKLLTVSFYSQIEQKKSDKQISRCRSHSIQPPCSNLSFSWSAISLRPDWLGLQSYSSRSPLHTLSSRPAE